MVGTLAITDNRVGEKVVSAYIFRKMESILIMTFADTSVMLI